MRTTGLLLAFWTLLNLLGCTAMNMDTVRSNPCAVQNSIECQMEQSAHVPN